MVASCVATGIPVALIGALAVRAHLSEPWRRATKDVDIVVPRGHEAGMDSLLRGLGFVCFAMGPWRRGERGGLRVDVAFGEVVDLASFVAFPIDLRAAEHRGIGGRDLPVLPLEELLITKLIAHRDRDLLDVVALARERSADAGRFRRLVAAADVEIAVRRGVLELAAGIELGMLAELWEQRAEHGLSSEDWAGVLGAIRALVGG